MKPFYWTAPSEPEAYAYVAKTGWYLYTDSGLKYLGESILDGKIIDESIAMVEKAEKQAIKGFAISE